MKYRSLRDYATHDLVVTHWMEKLDRAFEIMTEAGVRHLPVIDDDLAVIGIVSDRDFQRAMRTEKTNHVFGKIIQPEFDRDARVRDYMSWPVEAIADTTSIGEAARLMIDKKISSLVVTRGDRIIGIVTTEDLLRALLEGSESTLSDLKVDLQTALYQSPIGQIAQALANVGI